MSFIEIALRAYLVVAALPVLGFTVVLIVDLSTANKKRRQDLHHSHPTIKQAQTGLQVRR